MSFVVVASVGDSELGVNLKTRRYVSCTTMTRSRKFHARKSRFELLTSNPNFDGLREALKEV